MELKIRIDKWMKQRFPQLKNRHIQEALEKELVRYEGHAVRKGEKIPADAQLDAERLIRYLEELKSLVPSFTVEVVAKTDGFVVVDKPAGVASQPLSLFDHHTLTQWGLHHFPEAREAFPEIQPELAVHRLDLGTSGVQILALDPAHHQTWRSLFDTKKVQKTYLAWCWGIPQADSWTIDTPLVADGPKRMRVQRPSDSEKHSAVAHTRVEVVRRNGKFVLVRAHCQTGARHQVRVHLAASGFPLIGDQIYGAPDSFKVWAPKHHLLRASQIDSPLGTFRVDTSEFENLVSKEQSKREI